MKIKQREGLKETEDGGGCGINLSFFLKLWLNNAEKYVIAQIDNSRERTN